jgi:hypothetical protein
MRLDNFRVTQAENHVELACDATPETSGAPPFTIWHRFPSECQGVSAVAEPFLTALLVPCMRQKEDVTVHGRVSAKLLASVGTLMDIFASWDSSLSRISIDADETYAADRGGNCIGAYFSCGVDSFYTLLKNMEEHPRDENSITHLLIMRGFDLNLTEEHDALWDRLVRTAEHAARETGKRLIPVVTNAREHIDQYTWGRYPPGDLWGRCAHGGLLASIGLSLGRDFSMIIVPASYSYAQLFPWGSHPLLEPLWSTEALEVAHDGCECARTQKIARQIARSPLALEILRVCWSGTDYNCCTCEKCLRTVIALDLVGALDRCRAFELPLSRETCIRLRIQKDKDLVYWSELAAEAGRAGRADLQKMIELCLSNPKTVPRRIKREFDRFVERISDLRRRLTG